MEVAPKCSYFGQCGGCDAQNIDYERQLLRKKRKVWHALKGENVIVNDIAVFSGEPYNYRTRMDFVFFKEGLGLRKKGEFQNILAIKECSISNTKLNILLKELWSWYERNRENIIPNDLVTHEGDFKYVVIRAPESGDSAVVFTISDKSSAVEPLISDFAEKTSAKNVILCRVPALTDVSVSSDLKIIKGSGLLNEILCGKKIAFSSQSFFQNNSGMAEKLINYVQTLVQKYPAKDSKLIDLYGGAGTFGVTLGHLFKDFTIIENDALNVECALRNLKQNSISNGMAVCADAKLLQTFRPENLFVITDPPRAGMHPKVIKEIKRLAPEHIIYVSCNPKQMAKELPLFDQYELVSVAIFDLFPQTPHVEAVVELILRGRTLQ